nr:MULTISPECIES: site-specific integrase [unclassified Pseudomonas]
MATIRARKLADGTVSYTAQIRIKRDGVQVYQESQTFARKQAAQAWVRKRESELDQPGAIERASRKGVTVKDMIDQYLLEVEKARPLGKTKKATLEAIGKMDIGKLNDTDITTQCLVDFALWRMSGEGGGVQPQTAGNDLAHLGAVLAIAKDAWVYQVDPLAMGGARRVLRKLGYNLKSRERDRRPTLDELGKVLAHFQAMQRRRLPEWISALQSALLNESATLFRRKYYENGSHAGFILYMTDAAQNEADVDSLRKALKDSKGPGNFRNLFVYSPNGKKDGLQIIPVSEVTAKDEFNSIKNQTRDDVLASLRIPPQLMGIMPRNAGGFGSIREAAQIYAANELEPIQRVWRS